MSQMIDIITEVEVNKVRKYLEGDNHAQIEIACSKIDKFIRAYLSDLKANGCNDLNVAIKGVEEWLIISSKNQEENIVYEQFAQRFFEYIELMKKIKELPQCTEKERIIKNLEVRGLWKIT